MRRRGCLRSAAAAGALVMRLGGTPRAAGEPGFDLGLQGCSLKALNVSAPEHGPILRAC